MRLGTTLLPIMLPSRRLLLTLSRDPATLRRAVLLTAAVFLLTAVWASFTRPATPNPASLPDAHTTAIRDLLLTPNPDRSALLRALRDHARREARRAQKQEVAEAPDGPPLSPAAPPSPPNTLATLLAASALPDEEKVAFLQWHQAIRTAAPAPEFVQKLLSLPMPAAPGLPQVMAADLKRFAGQFQEALADYETAGAAPHAAEARRQAIELAVSRDWQEVLSRLLAQPSYYQAVHATDDFLSHTVAQEQMDFALLLRRMGQNVWSGFSHLDYFILSLLCTAVWFFSLHQAARVPRRLWWSSLVGLLLGAASTIPTLVLFSLQMARHGLADSDLAGPALLFQIASVGLREEASKLLCLVPLLLFLRKGTPAQALMAASCAGLGFALEENISYFNQSGGESVPGRFVTATFMHLGLTGLNGLALFKFLRYPKNFGTPFLATFVCTVLLHGFYNFSLDGFDNPFSRELAMLTPVMLVGLAWYYFLTLRQEQDDAPQRLSAEATFLLGSTILMGTLLNFHVWNHGWLQAITLLIPSLLTYLFYGWLFHHFLRHA